MLEPNIHKTCSLCNEEKYLIEFAPQKDKCKKCYQKRKTPTIMQILSKNDSLKLPWWKKRRI